MRLTKRILCCTLSIALMGANIPVNIGFEPITANAVSTIEKDSKTLV